MMAFALLSPPGARCIERIIRNCITRMNRGSSRNKPSNNILNALLTLLSTCIVYHAGGAACGRILPATPNTCLMAHFLPPLDSVAARQSHVNAVDVPKGQDAITGYVMLRKCCVHRVPIKGAVIN